MSIKCIEGRHRFVVVRFNQTKSRLALTNHPPMLHFVHILIEFETNLIYFEFIGKVEWQNEMKEK